MALLQINPDFAFKDNQALFSNGVWTDPDTGLTWMSCALGQQWSSGSCQGKAESLSWKDAVLKTDNKPNTPGYFHNFYGSPYCPTCPALPSK